MNINEFYLTLFMSSFTDAVFICNLPSDPSILLSAITSSNRKSILFNLLGSFMNRNQIAANLIDQGFRVMVENGLNVRFWTDN